ncbi:abortive infection family protein [Luteimonas sp. RIT-PG2_3]
MPHPAPLPPLSKPTLFALIEALEVCLDAADWAKLGIELELPQLGDPEMRLQQALRFGDDDYGYQVAQFATFMDSEKPNELRALAARPELKAWLEEHASDAARELGVDLAHVPAPHKLPTAAEAVDGALKDAIDLLHTHGTASALDRVHSALQDYLLDACARANLAVPPNASIDLLFKTLRSGHDRITTRDHQAARVAGVLGSLASAVTALDDLRSDASAAHPGPANLGKAEAMLMINMVRALFDYLETQRGQLHGS